MPFRKLLQEYRHAGNNADIIYRTLRHCILHGQFAPGERLLADTLARQLTVSRTPVRDALRKLEAEGLVAMSPRTGLVVLQLGEKELFEIFTVREALEGMAARLAATESAPPMLSDLREAFRRMESACHDGDLIALVERIGEFQRLLYAASKCDYLAELLRIMKDRTKLFRHSPARVVGSPHETLNQYRQLLDAIEQKDADLAERVAREHRRVALEIRQGIFRDAKVGSDRRRNRR